MSYRGPDPKPESLSAVESSNAGDVKVSAENTSNTASSSATIEAKVAGGSAADPSHTALINGGEQFTWGIDNSDSDKFKLSDSAALGTNDVFEVDSNQILKTTKASYAGSGRLTNIGDANYTVTDTDGFDIVYTGTTLTADRTVTLPTAADNAGRTLLIKKADSGAFDLIVDGEGSETIDGATTITMRSQYDWIKIVCDGSNWLLLDKGWAVSVVQDSFSTGVSPGTSYADVSGLTVALTPGTWLVTCNFNCEFGHGTSATVGFISAHFQFTDSSSSVVTDGEWVDSITKHPTTGGMNEGFQVTKTLYVDVDASETYKIRSKHRISAGTGGLTIKATGETSSGGNTMGTSIIAHKIDF